MWGLNFINHQFSAVLGHQLMLVVYPIIYIQGFIHPRWCRISSINSITCPFLFSSGVVLWLGFWKTNDPKPPSTRPHRAPKSPISYLQKKTTIWGVYWFVTSFLRGIQLSIYVRGATNFSIFCMSTWHVIQCGGPFLRLIQSQPLLRRNLMNPETHIQPRKQTCKLKMTARKGDSYWTTTIYRFYVKFRWSKSAWEPLWISISFPK